MSKVEMDRGSLHQHLDEWMDSIEADPLWVGDGEEHFFKVRGGRVACDAEDHSLVGFVVTSGSTREI